MELTLDNNRATFMITEVTDDLIKINSDVYEQSLIVTPNKVLPNWPIGHISELEPSHIETLTALKPKLVILSTGKQHQLLDPQLMAMFLSQGIGVECMETRAAARTFNVLMSEGREAVAGLILDPGSSPG